jgi:hypothetical protein
MGQINENELQAMGYKKKFDYSQYSHDNDVNVIPKNDFKRLIRDTFKTITEVVKETYGPYGSQYTLNELNQTSSTKDGYNTFEAIHFSHQYKQMVKLTIGKICSRVNEVVGDGTTSCLLLAEKIFDSINETLKTPEDERRIDSILTDIQKFFNDSLEFAKEYDLVKPLTHQSLESVIMMAANHDKRLRDTIINALDVKYDSESNVSSINNVSIQSRIDQGVSTKYEILKMPGNYRVEVGMFPNDIVSLADKKNVVLLVYDHNFNVADWAALLDAYTTKYFLNKPANVLNSDGTLSKNTTDDIERPTILICAVHFDQAVIDDHIKRFLQNEYRIGRKHNLIPVTIRGSYARNEARDLAAVADVPCHTLYTPKIEFEDFDKTTTVTVFNNDCLCLYDVKPPVDYIDALNIDMQNEESSSRRMLMKKRIDAMTMAKSDTTINLTVPNSLEQKMIEDKIDDCISIIESAFEYGCVPNLFKYAHKILNMYKSDEHSSVVVEKIISSIEGIFTDVWVSKNGSFDELCNERLKSYYDSYDCSYDVLEDTFCDINSLATSVQYDIEVVCATLEIVRFLLTSRGLIFDSCLLQMHGDNGTYVPM